MKFPTVWLKEALHLVMGQQMNCSPQKCTKKIKLMPIFKKSGQRPGNPMTRLDKQKYGFQNRIVRRALSFLQ